MSRKTKHMNILSISGEGRNVGKTLLACNIIAKFSHKTEIIGVKITPHFHKDTGEAELIETRNGISLYKETNYLGIKDTSRMLAAGAKEAYLVQLSENMISDVLNILETKFGRNILFVCESGKVLSEIQTGISLFVRKLNGEIINTEKKNADLNIDRIVTCNLTGFDIDLDEIIVHNNCWKLKKVIHNA